MSVFDFAAIVLMGGPTSDVVDHDAPLVVERNNPLEAPANIVPPGVMARQYTKVSESPEFEGNHTALPFGKCKTPPPSVAAKRSLLEFTSSACTLP